MVAVYISTSRHQYPTCTGGRIGEGADQHTWQSQIIDNPPQQQLPVHGRKRDPELLMKERNHLVHSLVQPSLRQFPHRLEGRVVLGTKLLPHRWRHLLDSPHKHQVPLLNPRMDVPQRDSIPHQQQAEIAQRQRLDEPGTIRRLRNAALAPPPRGIRRARDRIAIAGVQIIRAGRVSAVVGDGLRPRVCALTPGLRRLCRNTFRQHIRNNPQPKSPQVPDHLLQPLPIATPIPILNPQLLYQPSHLLPQQHLETAQVELEALTPAQDLEHALLLVAGSTRRPRTHLAEPFVVCRHVELPRSHVPVLAEPSAVLGEEEGLLAIVDAAPREALIFHRGVETGAGCCWVWVWVWVWARRWRRRAEGGSACETTGKTRGTWIGRHSTRAENLR